MCHVLNAAYDQKNDHSLAISFTTRSPTLITLLQAICHTPTLTEPDGTKFMGFRKTLPMMIKAYLWERMAAPTTK